MNNSLQVTFVVWQGLTAILPDQGRGVGGLEVCAWRLAKGLAAHDEIEVRMIVRAPNKLRSRVIDGVEVVFVAQPREYVRRDVSDCIDFEKKRIKRFSWRLLWQFPYLLITWPFRQKDPEPMQPDHRLDAYATDVWVTFGSSREAAGVAATAMVQGKPLLLMLQSNADLDPRYLSDPSYRSAYGEVGEHCVFSIRNATTIACQTNVQAAMLNKYFERDGEIVRNLTDAAAFQSAAQEPGDYVLWIGRYDRVHKRPHLAIEIARLCPDVPFRMVINDSDEAVRGEIHKALPDNVKVIDYVPFDEQPSLFGNARIFFSTGSAEYEGFPTVLLQAVAARKPIVSLDDFDHFIERSGSGQVVGDQIKLAANAIQSFWEEPDSYDHQAASEYLDQHHGLEAITNQVRDIVVNLNQKAE